MQPKRQVSWVPINQLTGANRKDIPSPEKWSMHIMDTQDMMGDIISHQTLDGEKCAAIHAGAELWKLCDQRAALDRAKYPMLLNWKSGRLVTPVPRSGIASGRLSPQWRRK